MGPVHAESELDVFHAHEGVHFRRRRRVYHHRFLGHKPKVVQRPNPLGVRKQVIDEFAAVSNGQFTFAAFVLICPSGLPSYSNTPAS